MKISIDKHILQKSLEQAVKFLPKKNVFPILGEFLFEATEDGLYITGGDGTQFLQSKIDSDDYQLINLGSATIPGKRIVDIVKVMKGVIDIETKGSETEILSGRKNTISQVWTLRSIQSLWMKILKVKQ